MVLDTDYTFSLELVRSLACFSSNTHAAFSFQTGWSHILLVTENPGSDTGAMGVVTLEDVVEVGQTLMRLDSADGHEGVDRWRDHRM